MISINVNVEKIDKRKLYKGKKGTYLNLTLFEVEEGSESSEYGDFIVKQQGQKGEKMPILGNGKVFKPKERNENRKRDRDDDDNDKIPF